MSKKQYLKYFMWGFQVHYQISVKVRAERCFSHIHSSLMPEVILLGIKEENLEKMYICPEDDDCSVNIQDLGAFKDEYKKIMNNDPERNIIHSLEQAQKNANKRMHLKNIAKTFENLLGSIDVESKYYSSFPVLVDGIYVCVILKFNKQSFNIIPLLDEFLIHGRYPASRSYLNSLIQEFLDFAREGLFRPSPQSTIDKDVEELYRDAAKSLLRQRILKLGSIEGYWNFYETCNNLSLLQYEKRDLFGGFVVTNSDDERLDFILKFRKGFRLDSSSRTRKFLEMTNDEIYLVTDSVNVLGLAKINDQKGDDLLKVKFLSRGYWTVTNEKKLILEVKDGIPYQPIDINQFDYIKSIFVRIFKDDNLNKLNEIQRIVSSLSYSQHGAMLIIVSNAKSEVSRLSSQLIEIEPAFITDELLSSVANIDGGILTDNSGKCFAIGTILDGVVGKKGDSGRGSRYNSAVRYIETFKNGMVVVFSTDGTIDVIPNLKPQVSRQLIDDQLKKLKECFSDTEFNRKDFNAVMDWLKDHMFYLSEADCNLINKLVFEEGTQAMAMGELRVIWPEFVINEDMTNEYYL